MTTTLTLPNLDKMFPGIPARQESPRIDRDYVPDPKTGGKAGFESRETTTTYQPYGEVSSTAVRTSSVTNDLSVSASGKETSTFGSSRDMVTIDNRLTIEQNRQANKTDFSIKNEFGTQYSYNIDNGVASFTVSSGGSTKKISAEEFLKGVNEMVTHAAERFGDQPDFKKALLAYAESFTPTAEKPTVAIATPAPASAPAQAASKPTLPPATPAPIGNDTLIAGVQPGATLRIRTDGHDTIISNGDQASRYHDQQFQGAGKPLIGGSFRPDAFHGGKGTNIDLMNDEALKAALPEGLRKQIAEALKNGVTVMIEHDAPSSANAPGNKPAPAKTR